jgi:hypothetical protein
MTSRASAIVSAYAYRQRFPWQVHAGNEHTIEPTTNTLASTRRAYPRSGLRPCINACASDGSLSMATCSAAVAPEGLLPTTGKGGVGE